ncbi:MAG: hypothetical protein AAGA56_06125 [Myxococcota bacterium]
MPALSSRTPISIILRSLSHAGALLETSRQDAFVDLNRRLSQQLKKRSVEHDWLMPPGPHNQPFLRESGTLEMLLWHERVASRG